MYMDEQNSQHCIPLTSELFRSGWDPMSTIKVKDNQEIASFS
jgi:hypothetical protein